MSTCPLRDSLIAGIFRSLFVAGALHRKSKIKRLFIRLVVIRELFACIRSNH